MGFDLLTENLFAGHAAAAAGSVAGAAFLTHPLDTLKTLLQVNWMCIISIPALLLRIDVMLL